MTLAKRRRSRGARSQPPSSNSDHQSLDTHHLEFVIKIIFVLKVNALGLGGCLVLEAPMSFKRFMIFTGSGWLTIAWLVGSNSSRIGNGIFLKKAWVGMYMHSVLDSFLFCPTCISIRNFLNCWFIILRPESCPLGR